MSGREGRESSLYVAGDVFVTGDTVYSCFFSFVVVVVELFIFIFFFLLFLFLFFFPLLYLKVIN